MKQKILLLLLAAFLAWNFAPLLLAGIVATGPLVGTLFKFLLSGGFKGLDPEFYLQFIIGLVLFFLLLQGLGLVFSFALPKNQQYGTTKALRRVQGFMAEVTIILVFFFLLPFAVSLAMNGWPETNKAHLYVNTLRAGWPLYLLGAMLLWALTNRYIKRWLVSMHAAVLLDFIEIGRFGQGGSARFAGLIEEWALRYQTPKKGQAGPLFLGRSLYERGLHLGSEDDRMMFTLAGTRGNKGTAVIIPNLLLWGGSAIVIDPKGTNAIVTARRRRELGHDVYIFDPFNVLEPELQKIGKTFAQVFGKEKSDSFNPLASLNLADLTIREDVGVIADALVVPDAMQKDTHWDDSAKSLLSGLIAQIITPLLVGDLLNPQSFIRKLAAQKDPLSAYLYRQLAGETQELLTTYLQQLLKAEKAAKAKKPPVEEEAPVQPDAGLIRALLADVNKILAGPSFYTPERFASVKLHTQTEYLLAQNPTGDELLRLNRLLLTDAYPQDIARRYQKPSLPKLRDLLTLETDAEAALLAGMMENRAAGSLARDAASRIIQGLGTDEIANIRSNANKHTHWMGSEALQGALSQEQPTFAFARLKQKPSTVYLVLPPRFLDIHRRWLRLFINLTLKEISQGGRSPIPILMLLDEFQQLGKLPEIVRAYRLLAGYNCCVWCFAQDWPGMVQLYGNDAKTFLSNSRAIQVFSLNDEESLELVSKHIGTRSMQQVLGMNSLRNTRLRTPDEAGKQASRRSRNQYILRAGEAPVICERVQYYEDKNSWFGRWLTPPDRSWRVQSEKTWQSRFLKRYFPFHGLYDPDPDYDAKGQETDAS